MSTNYYEGLLWQTTFPRCCRFCEEQGLYTMFDQDVLLKALEDGLLPQDPLGLAQLRLDLAIFSLWQTSGSTAPALVFPHRLAAAAAMLRAAGPQPTELSLELNAALSALEGELAAAEQAQGEAKPVAAAAEEEEG